MGRTASTTIRALFVFLDTIMALLGIAVLGLAVYLFFAQQLSQMSAEHYRMPLLLYVIMGIGAITGLLSALGIAGAVCRSYCALILYAALFSLVVAIQCVAILFAYIFKANVEAFTSYTLDELLAEYRSAPNKELGTVLDFVQSLFRCCGVRGFIDYIKNLQSLPPSCCASVRRDFTGTCTVPLLNGQIPGCTQRITDILYGPSMPITLGVYCSLLFVELSLLVMACYLCHRFRRERD